MTSWTEQARIADAHNWTLLTRPDGWGGVEAVVMSNRNSDHPSNYTPEIHLDDIDPAQLRAFAAELAKVADILEYAATSRDEL